MYRPHRPVPIPLMPRGCTDISAMRQHGNNGELCSFLLSLTCFCTQVPSAHVGMHDPPPLPICLRTCTAHPHATCLHAHLPAYPPAPLLARSLTHSLIHPPFLPILPPVLLFSCLFSHSPTRSPAHSSILPLIHPLDRWRCNTQHRRWGHDT